MDGSAAPARDLGSRCACRRTGRPGLAGLHVARTRELSSHRDGRMTAQTRTAIVGAPSRVPAGNPPPRVLCHRPGPACAAWAPGGGRDLALLPGSRDAQGAIRCWRAGAIRGRACGRWRIHVPGRRSAVAIGLHPAGLVRDPIISAQEFDSTSTDRWHLLFGSSWRLVVRVRGRSRRDADCLWRRRGCSSRPGCVDPGATTALGTSVRDDPRGRRDTRLLSRDHLRCGERCAARHAVSTAVGCYFTLFASLGAMIVAYWSSPRRHLADSAHGYRRSARSPGATPVAPRATDGPVALSPRRSGRASERRCPPEGAANEGSDGLGLGHGGADRVARLSRGAPSPPAVARSRSHAARRLAPSRTDAPQARGCAPSALGRAEPSLRSRRRGWEGRSTHVEGGAGSWVATTTPPRRSRGASVA